MERHDLVPLAADFDGPLNAMVTMPNGDVVVSGNFNVVPGAYANAIARWNGATWSSLGAWTGPGPSGNVRPLTTLPGGDLLVCGQFAGASVHQFARWDGTTWFPLGPAMTLNFLGIVYDLVILPNGDWVIGGSFTSIGGVPVNNIALWNGTTWSALGTGTNYPVVKVKVLPNGDVVAAGQFTTAGGVNVGHVARWNGVGWSAFGSGLTGGTWSPGAYALLVLPNGDLVVGGDFTSAGGVPASHVAQWRDGNWRRLGAGTNAAVGTLALLPDGDLVASGGFTRAGGVAARGLARWNGTVWSAFAPGTDTAGGVLGSLANGDLLIAGRWPPSGPSGTGSTWLARLTTTCPAIAVPAGNGCSGSGGPNVLAAASLPWLGATFRADATGMPANGLALSVFGLAAAATPLAALLPQGLPGCTLLVAPDLRIAGVPSAGTLSTQLAIPNTVALATQTFRLQVVALELGAAGAITAATSTNALAVTIGAF